MGDLLELRTPPAAGLLVDRHDRRPVVVQKHGGGDTRFSHADHGYFLSRQLHAFPYRNFNVLIARSASRIEMIQNRTITFGSAQPLSSK